MALRPLADPLKNRPPRLFTPLRWLIAAAGFLCRVVLLAWAALAINYSNLPWAGARLALVGVFLGFGIWALWLARGKRAFLIFAGVYLALLAWWSTIRPSHDRPWRKEVALMPRAIIDGDRLRITGFRNFKYRSRDDFDVRYEERKFLLSHLTSLDFFVSYWKVGPVGHTFVSFNFDNAPPLAISIETRPEVGEGFDPLASLFKQFELIYVVGDEPDLVGVRTTHRNEEVFLYRIRASPDATRRLLLVYLDRINQLADHPEWYHLLSNSCTINIVRYANAAGRIGRFDLHHLLNGFIDQYLYHSGAVDTTLPFEELRRRSRINDAARAADGAPDFSQQIRASLPLGSLY
jgi:Domain of unknown function (DUF4105)